jgi:hypothetical protein
MGVGKPTANTSGVDSPTVRQQSPTPPTPPTDDSLYTSLVTQLERFLADVADGFAFHTNDFDDFAGIKGDRQAKNIRSVIFNRYCGKGRLEHICFARYREIKTKLTPVNWQDADVEDLLKLAYPLGMERVIKTYKGSILVTAGVSHSGKTALAYQFILRNMHNPMGVHLFTTTDMDEVEIMERMSKSGFVIPNPAPFNVWEMPPNPADQVQANAINVYDYVDLNSELYMIGDILEKIQAKLERGFAWVNIQKKEGEEFKLGTGGQFSIKRPKIYLALDMVTDSGKMAHQITLVKCRGRANPELNPVGYKYKFKLIDGIKMAVIEEG